jgi:hypothetical protein
MCVRHNQIQPSMEPGAQAGALIDWIGVTEDNNDTPDEQAIAEASRI